MEIADRANPQPRRFVLLKHLLPALAQRQTHWDLMIDFGEKLLTFEMRELPQNLSPGATCDLEVTRLADHRRVYLDYQGPLTADASAGVRGSVQRVAAGVAQCLSSEATTPARYRLAADRLTAEFEVRLCAVGQQTQMRVFTWQWSANSG